MLEDSGVVSIPGTFLNKTSSTWYRCRNELAKQESLSGASLQVTSPYNSDDCSLCCKLSTLSGGALNSCKHYPSAKISTAYKSFVCLKYQPSPIDTWWLEVFLCLSYWWKCGLLKKTTNTWVSKKQRKSRQRVLYTICVERSFSLFNKNINYSLEIMLSATLLSFTGNSYLYSYNLFFINIVHLRSLKLPFSSHQR